MKPNNSQITAFLRAPNPLVRVVLIYGPDAGLVKERAAAIARKTVADLDDPFRVARLSSEAAQEPATLADEMASLALGGGRRLVWVPRATEAMHAALAALLASLPATDALLLIEAGDLDRKSKLRAVIENGGEESYAIPCYQDDAGARARQIIDQLKEFGLAIPRDVLMEMAPLLPPDRAALRSEVAKLALYAHGKTSVTLEDVRAILQDAAEAAQDDLVMATASGDVKRVGLLLDRLAEEQTSPVSLLRAAQRHFLRLQNARAHMDKGFSAAEAVDKLQPKVFWKQRDAMIQQTATWAANELDAILARLYETEAAVKRTGAPDQILCGQLFLMIGQRAAKRAR